MFYMFCSSGILPAKFISNTFFKAFEPVNRSDVPLLLAFNLKKRQPYFSSFGFLAKNQPHFSPCFEIFN